MRKSILTVLALGLVASLAPMSAQAEHCSKDVLIFSYTVPAAYDLGSGVCNVDEGEDVDGRIIYPAATQIAVRYLLSVENDPAFIYADLSGSLFPTGKRVKLIRGPGLAGGFFYDSANVAIPRTASGCVTADVEVPGEDPEDTLDETSYRHATATC